MEFCVSKCVGLHNKNSLKHYEKSLKELKTASTNSLCPRIPPGGHIIGRIFVSEIWGDYFREDLFFWWGFIIGILRYLVIRQRFITAIHNNGSGIWERYGSILQSTMRAFIFQATPCIDKTVAHTNLVADYVFTSRKTTKFHQWRIYP